MQYEELIKSSAPNIIDSEMWYLNYCAPFLNNDPIMKIARYILLSDLLVLFLMYIAILLYYQCSTPKMVEAEAPSQQQLPPASQNSLNGKLLKEYHICGLKFMPRGEFRRGFSVIFGHHAVAVASCILYSPYIAQIVMSGVYVFLCLVLFLFILLKFEKLTTAVYVVMMLLNVGLLFSSVLGVGASKLNENKMECSLDQSS